MAKIITINQKSLELAAELLLNNQLVIFPTETVYGLGANALSDSAVEKIYQAKNRPSQNPLIVHLANLDQISEYTILTNQHKNKIHQLAKFIPGPLSIIVPVNNKISKIVTAGNNSVAIRIPSLPATNKLLGMTNIPIAAPSANPAGKLSTTNVKDLDSDLLEKVALVLDAGDCQFGLESTVLSLLNEQPELLRPGSVTLEQLESVLGKIKINAELSTRILLSPGLLSSHYQPTTPLKLNSQLTTEDFLKKIAYLSFNPNTSPNFQPVLRITLDLAKDPNQSAALLFKSLHQLDRSACDLIIVEECDLAGVGLAIMDRLIRATIK